MVNVIVVPEKNKYIKEISHDNVIWINSKLGKPNINGRNVKYVAPFWLGSKNKGVNRIYHITSYKTLASGTTEIKLGNSFIVDPVWDKMGSHRKFEYHSLSSFDYVEITAGLLLLI